MEEIKDLVNQALEQKRVLSKLKAELRAEVFLAIDEQEKKHGSSGLAHKTDNNKRASLHSSTTGLLLVGLVREFLEWSGMEFTLKVFEPEMLSDTDRHSRGELARRLGVTAEPDAPLLMSLLTKEPRETEVKPDLPPPKPSLVPKLNFGSPTKAAPEPEPLQPLAAPRGTPPALQATGAPPVPAASQPPKPTAAVAPPPAAAAAPAAPVLPAPPSKAPATTVSDHSYADDIDVDIDDDLEGAEIMDDDEDYESVFAGKQQESSSAGGAAPPPPPATAAKQPLDPLPAVQPPAPSGAAAGTGAGAGRAAVDASDNYEDSGLSATYIPGRLRPLKRLSGNGGSSFQDDGASNRSMDIMTGDRSFGMSHELGGLTSHPVGGGGGGLSQSEGLSFSGELSGMMPGADQGKAAATSASMSGEFPRPIKLDSLPTPSTLGLKPPLPKLGALTPLGKPGALPPPPSLAPLGGVLPPPVGGLALAPLGGPAAAASATAAASRRDPKDIKAELRKAGLLTSDSISNAGSTKSDNSHDSLDLPDNTQDSMDLAALAPAPTTTTSAGGAASRPPRPSPAPGSSGGSGGGGVPQASTTTSIRPVHGGVYDAEVSVMTSADQSMDIPADMVEEEDLRSSLDSEFGAGRSGLGAAGMYHPSKGLSMDLRDTGLSTSDKSGDLDKMLANADFAETAEWS